ncbi:MAG: hypothetical protein MK207_06815 [Saprospiraceae bacterium]|nr:hypothetical protein [Saprospiraceae bacterium]
MTNNFFSFLFIGLTVSIFACNNNNNQVTLDNVNESTRTAQSKSMNNKQSDITDDGLIKKWIMGDEYIDLVQTGTFEAVLDGIHIEGKWGLSTGTDDKKILELFGEEDSDLDGVAQSFHKKYELISVSYDRLIAVDAAGNTINFLSGN